MNSTYILIDSHVYTNLIRMFELHCLCLETKIGKKTKP